MATTTSTPAVPKTLIQHLIRWVIGSRQFDADDRRDAGGDPRHRDLARAGARPTRRRDAAEHRGDRSAPTSCRTSTSTTSLRFGLRPSQGRLPGAGTPGATRSAATGRRLPAGAARRLRPGDDQAMAGGVPLPLLRVQPVQALGDAERAEGRLRRLALAARRLARAVRRERQRLARRAGAERAERRRARRPAGPARLPTPTDAPGSTRPC